MGTPRRCRVSPWRGGPWAAGARPLQGSCCQAALLEAAQAAGPLSALLGLSGGRAARAGADGALCAPFPVHRQSQGAPGARVTRLPSLRLLTKVVGFYGPVSVRTASAPPREPLGFPTRPRNGLLTEAPCSLAQEASLTARTVEALILAEVSSGCLCLALDGCGRAVSQHADGAKGGRKVAISWPLAWRGTSATGDCPGQLGSGPQLSLFGQPLALICGPGDALPQPVQELLDLLYERGPATEGIFRKAANEKARRELREELDRGTQVDLSSKPVHLLAVVLKDFLRNIPCKLLVADLYDKWLLALEKPSLQEKIAGLREVAGLLPPANRLLLRRLLSVLHHISESAESNRMDASNLAICVGPNMLSPDMDTTLPLAVQKESNDKVTLLVELLIHNCAAVFGDDVASTEESREHTASSTGAAQQNSAACNSPEPAAEGSPVNCHQEQQPKAASALGSSTYPTCLSAPPLTNQKKEVSNMPRSFSEADLSCQSSSLEGRRWDPEAAKREEPFPIQETKCSVEKGALETTPCHPAGTLIKWHSLPTISSGCSLQSSFSPLMARSSPPLH
ncbi:T-cell activation Rho GTPase-activating protein-like [Rhea pennata]|uniref:T-cell activation Rho GTPase-activating protein-like n=1 Tax=Rhea pennata TaxID=8795 RepID=UPI002E2669C4